jgi:hypothetical protein
MLAAERLQVYRHDRGAEWGDLPKPAAVQLQFWSPAVAQIEYLKRFDSLGLRRRLP